VTTPRYTARLTEGTDRLGRFYVWKVYDQATMLSFHYAQYKKDFWNPDFQPAAFDGWAY
jgi:hypothetical protein